MRTFKDYLTGKKEKDYKIIANETRKTLAKLSDVLINAKDLHPKFPEVEKLIDKARQILFHITSKVF